MLTDTVIAVDPDDRVTGGASKLAAHTFGPTSPSGVLHRAFSVFLFDEEDRLLLQVVEGVGVCEWQRAGVPAAGAANGRPTQTRP